MCRCSIEWGWPRIEWGWRDQPVWPTALRVELLPRRVTNFEGSHLYSMPMSPALPQTGILEKCLKAPENEDIIADRSKVEKAAEWRRAANFEGSPYTDLYSMLWPKIAFWKDEIDFECSRKSYS